MSIILSEHFRLTEFTTSLIAVTRRIDNTPPLSAVSNLQLMVMMESFLSKSKNFLSEGKLAVGIKFTKDGMDIVEHIGKLGYVLFHTRKDTDQHLYSIKGDCKILPAEELEAGTYKSINTTSMYVLVELDAASELPSAEIHSSKKKYTPTTRYDAQYATIAALSEK